MTGRRIDVLAGGLRPPARTYASRGLLALAALSMARSAGRESSQFQFRFESERIPKGAGSGIICRMSGSTVDGLEELLSGLVQPFCCLVVAHGRGGLIEFSEGLSPTAHMDPFRDRLNGARV